MQCQALPLFHSLTRCDSTISLLGVPKHTALKKWLESDNSIITATANLTTQNLNLVLLTDNPDAAIFERFVSSMF